MTSNVPTLNSSRPCYWLAGNPRAEFSARIARVLQQLTRERERSGTRPASDVRRLIRISVQSVHGVENRRSPANVRKRPVAFEWLFPSSMAATSYFNERSCTILVVEDEALIRDILHIVLKRMGHVVLEGRDGAEGLTVSRNFNGRIDLVIADVQMPKMDGLTMVRLLQAKWPGMKVLLMSGYSAESVPKHWMKNFLHKPFPPATIEQRVQEMLACDAAGIPTQPNGSGMSL